MMEFRFKKELLRFFSLVLCMMFLFPAVIFAEGEEPAVTPEPPVQEGTAQEEPAQDVEAEQNVAEGPSENAAIQEPSENASQAQEAVENYPKTAAEIAALLREGMYDVTGNGVADENDALAMMMHMNGSLPDLQDLPKLLSTSILGEKHLDAFSYTGVVQDENSYRSPVVSVSITTVTKPKLRYYVADILVRDINCFRTQFAKDRYSATEHVEATAERNNAIIATNGDYYRARKGGIIIRNGEVYRKIVLKDRDVCVLYKDGTMECYSPNKVKVNDILAKDPFQSWTFGPSLLLEDGSPKTARKQFLTGVFRANPRTAIGYVEPGHYMLVVVDGRKQNGSLGLDMIGLSSLMSELGCKVAYNLDGGGTSVMTSAAYGPLNKQTNSERMCSDIVLVVDTSVGGN